VYASIFTGYTECVLYSPKGKYLAAVGRQGFRSNTLLFDAQGGYRTISECYVHRKPVRTVHFNFDSSQLVTASEDRTAIVFSVPDLTVIHTLSGHTSTVNCAVFFTYTVILTASSDGDVRVWDLTAGGESRAIGQHLSNARCVAVSPNGERIVSGGNNEMLNVYSSETYEIVKTIECRSNIERVTFYDDDTVLCGVYASDLVAVDIHTGAIIRSFGQFRNAWGIAVPNSSKTVFHSLIPGLIYSRIAHTLPATCSHLSRK